MAGESVTMSGCHHGEEEANLLSAVLFPWAPDHHHFPPLPFGADATTQMLVHVCLCSPET